MDRRAFVVSGSSTLIACTCSFARPHAARADHGCRAAAAGGVLLKDRIRHSSGRETVDRFCRDWRSAIVSEFELRPGLAFFEDGDQPNSLATPAALIPEGPDGAVLLGICLINHELGPAP
jgi:hypothetical protein